VSRALSAAALVLALAGPAAAQTSPFTTPTAPATTTTVADPNALVRPTQLDTPPVAHRLTPNKALEIASRVPKIADLLRRHPGTHGEAYEKGVVRWQVSFFGPGKPRRETGQVIVDDATGAVVEAWTGFQVAWTMARGYPGAFGRIVNSPWIWVPLSILFVVPFFDPRRLRRWLHLDLLVLSGFSVSLAFFNHADIGISVPIAYPLLAYLLIRMLVVALRPRSDGPRISPIVPVTWLAVAVVFLLGFRIGLNATNSNVIDVGYAGVIGADRMAHGQPLYGHFPNDNQHGDTYGPVVYETYIPFEQLEPWHGSWDDLPAAHLAAIFFDLLCVALLFLVGRRARGPDLGVMLAYAWCAYPFTLYAANSNTNDSLVAALILLALLAAARPVARGAATALAGLTKFAPLALAPVLATHRLVPGRRFRGIALFAIGLLVTAAVVSIPLFLHDNLHDFYERSIDFQATRGSPFSIWGFRDWTGAQHVVQVLGVLLAVVLAFLPRRQDVAGLAAACAAVLLALELGVTHWFYLYIPWFFGLVMLALLGRSSPPPGRPCGSSSPSRTPASPTSSSTATTPA
jgi:hypothetical protein